MEWLLKNKVVLFIPGTPFLYKIVPSEHFAPQKQSHKLKKRNKNAMRNFTKNIPKTTPK